MKVIRVHFFKPTTRSMQSRQWGEAVIVAETGENISRSIPQLYAHDFWRARVGDRIPADIFLLRGGRPFYATRGPAMEPVVFEVAQITGRSA